MPVYEFKCDVCGNVFSEIRKVGDFHAENCEKCGSADVKKIMSGFASMGMASGPACAPSGGG